MIGDENPVGEMRECTLITSTYMYRDQVLGILGRGRPAAAALSGVISVVNETARQVTEVAVAGPAGPLPALREGPPGSGAAAYTSNDGRSRTPASTEADDARSRRRSRISGARWRTSRTALCGRGRDRQRARAAAQREREELHSATPTSRCCATCSRCSTTSTAPWPPAARRPPGPPPSSSGVELIQRELLRVLEKFGLTPLLRGGAALRSRPARGHRARVSADRPPEHGGRTRPRAATCSTACAARRPWSPVAAPPDEDAALGGAPRTTTRSSASHREPTRPSSRRRTARSPAVPPRPQPGGQAGRGALQGDQRGLRRPLRSRQARPVRPLRHRPGGAAVRVRGGLRLALRGHLRELLRRRRRGARAAGPPRRGLRYELEISLEEAAAGDRDQAPGPAARGCARAADRRRAGQPARGHLRRRAGVRARCASPRASSPWRGRVRSARGEGQDQLQPVSRTAAARAARRTEHLLVRDPGRHRRRHDRAQPRRRQRAG